MNLLQLFKLAAIYIALFSQRFQGAPVNSTREPLSPPPMINNLSMNMITSIIQNSSLLITPTDLKGIVPEQRISDCLDYYKEYQPPGVSLDTFLYREHDTPEALFQVIKKTLNNPDLKPIATVLALAQLTTPDYGILFTPCISGGRIRGQANSLEMRLHEFTSETSNEKKISRRNLMFSMGFATSDPRQIYINYTGRDMPGIFMHEATHQILNIIYGNNAYPYPRDQTVQSSGLSNVIEEVNNNLKTAYPDVYTHSVYTYTSSSVDDYFIHIWKESFTNYAEYKHDIEAIVKLPQALAQFDITIEQLPPKLREALTPLINFWKIIDRDIQTFIEDINALPDDWDIKTKIILTQKPRLKSLVLENKLNINTLYTLTNENIPILTNIHIYALLREDLITLSTLLRLTPLSVQALANKHFNDLFRDGIVKLKHLHDLGKKIDYDKEVSEWLRQKILTPNDLRQLSVCCLSGLIIPEVMALFNQKIITLNQIDDLMNEHSQQLSSTRAKQIYTLLHQKIIKPSDLGQLSLKVLYALDTPEISALFNQEMITLNQIYNLNKRGISALQETKYRDLFCQKNITIKELNHLPEKTAEITPDGTLGFALVISIINLSTNATSSFYISVLAIGLSLAFAVNKNQTLEEDDEEENLLNLHLRP